MPKLSDQFVIRPRGKYWLFTLAAESGLPCEVWQDWNRKSFSSLPDALAQYRFPATEIEAKRACRALIEYLKTETAPGPAGMAAKPLIPWLLEFWTPESDYARHKALVEKAPLSAGYIKASRRDIELYAAPYPEFEGLTVGGLTKKTVKSWLLWLAEKGLSGRKINLARQSVQVPVHDAYKNEEIPAYPFLNVETAYHEKKEKGVLTPAEVEKIEQAPIADPFRHLAVLLAARCGLRAGEVRGLQWGDIAPGGVFSRV
jgi:hypothetical protein